MSLRSKTQRSFPQARPCTSGHRKAATAGTKRPLQRRRFEQLPNRRARGACACRGARDESLFLARSRGRTGTGPAPGQGFGVWGLGFGFGVEGVSVPRCQSQGESINIPRRSGPINPEVRPPKLFLARSRGRTGTRPASAFVWGLGFGGQNLSRGGPVNIPRRAYQYPEAGLSIPRRA